MSDLASDEGYLSVVSQVVRVAQGRTYSSISLSGFTLLSTGSTSQFPSRSLRLYLLTVRCLHSLQASGQLRLGWQYSLQCGVHPLQQVGHPPLPPAHRGQLPGHPRPRRPHPPGPPGPSVQNDIIDSHQEKSVENSH